MITINELFQSQRMMKLTIKTKKKNERKKKVSERKSMMKWIYCYVIEWCMHGWSDWLDGYWVSGRLLAVGGRWSRLAGRERRSGPGHAGGVGESRDDDGAGRRAPGEARLGRERQVHGQGGVPVDRRPASAQLRRRFFRLHHDVRPQREKAEK